MPDEVRVLGRFEPSSYQSEIIETEIKAHLPKCCATERISVRVPDPRGVTPHPDNLQWHQDGGGTAGTVRHMIVWANEQPTEIKTSTGLIIKPKPNDLVWFNNDVVQHKQPTGTDETRRWFVCIRCSGTTTEQERADLMSRVVRT